MKQITTTVLAVAALSGLLVQAADAEQEVRLQAEAQQQAGQDAQQQQQGQLEQKGDIPWQWQQTVNEKIPTGEYTSGRLTRDAADRRMLRVIEDRDQKYMTSKIYKLKHTQAVNLTPWVLGAVKRYYKYSTVERCNYKRTGEEFLLVNTGVDMIPFVDDMIAKLDRPGKADELGSLIEGSGVYRFVYMPKYRSSADLVRVGPTVGSEDGEYFWDRTTSMLYWKDSLSDGKKSYDWYKIMDRPLPQVEVKLNIYEVSDDDLKELGIDYIAWKNGPGATLFSAGLDYLKFDSFTDIANVSNGLNVFSNLSHTWGGFMVAPQIDATFIRLLAQKGKARIATSGSITLINDYSHDPGPNNFKNAKYKIAFTPHYQNIVKDSDQNTQVKASSADISLYFRNPIINFNGGYEKEKAVTREEGAGASCVEFGYVLRVVDAVEKTNTGENVNNVFNFRSFCSVACGDEKLLATYDRTQVVMQNNSIPFLGDIPGFKYLVGASVESKSKTRVFITASVTAARPESDLSKWAGRLVTATEMLRDAEMPTTDVSEKIDAAAATAVLKAEETPALPIPPSPEKKASKDAQKPEAAPAAEVPGSAAATGVQNPEEKKQ